MKIDLGHKPEKSEIVSKPSESREYFPHLHLDNKDLPNLDVGFKGTAVIEFCVESVSINDHGSGKHKSVGLEIKSIKFNKVKKDESDELEDELTK